MFPGDGESENHASFGDLFVCVQDRTQIDPKSHGSRFVEVESSPRARKAVGRFFFPNETHSKCQRCFKTLVWCPGAPYAAAYQIHSGVELKALVALHVVRCCRTKVLSGDGEEKKSSPQITDLGMMPRRLAQFLKSGPDRNLAKIRELHACMCSVYVYVIVPAYVYMYVSVTVYVSESRSVVCVCKGPSFY